MAENSNGPEGSVHLDTADGVGQWAGHLNVGMLGLCGPEARQEALARLQEERERA